MRAAIFLVRAELRRRWRSLIVVALLVGLAGAVTLAAVAGARRTASSFDRFLESTGTQDVLVFDEHVSRADVARVRALPGVEAVGWAPFLALEGPTVRAVQGFATVGPLDDRTLGEVNRARIVTGRATAP